MSCKCWTQTCEHERSPLNVKKSRKRKKKKKRANEAGKISDIHLSEKKNRDDLKDRQDVYMSVGGIENRIKMYT